MRPCSTHASLLRPFSNPLNVPIETVFAFFQDRTVRDRPDYEEIETIIRETEERAYIIEKTDVEQARRIREKINRLRVSESACEPKENNVVLSPVGVFGESQISV
jgi:hypothetical protein